MRKGAAVGLILGVLIAAISLSACGGGGGTGGEAGSTGGEASLTKAVFIKRGNAMCKSAEAKRGAIINAAYQASSPNAKVTKTEQEELILAALKPYGQLISEFEELGLPSGDAKAAAVVAALEKSVEKAEKDPSTALSGSAFTELNKLAGEYGLSNCAL